jgi:hypothetical protein
MRAFERAPKRPTIVVPAPSVWVGAPIPSAPESFWSSLTSSVSAGAPLLRPGDGTRYL